MLGLPKKTHSHHKPTFGGSVMAVKSIDIDS